VLVMILYIIISILKHEDITKTLIYLIFGIMGISIIIMYYFKGKAVDFYAFGLIFPILLMFFFIIAYFNVEKSGNKEKFKLMKISLIIGMPISIFYIILFT
jgi:hypothetical protein